MSEVKTVKRYLYEGKEYKSLKEIKEALHNFIGEEVLNKINKKIEIKHKDLIPLLDILCLPEVRKALIKAYTVTAEILDEDEWDRQEYITVNILDV